MLRQICCSAATEHFAVRGALRVPLFGLRHGFGRHRRIARERALHITEMALIPDRGCDRPQSDTVLIAVTRIGVLICAEVLPIHLVFSHRMAMVPLWRGVVAQAKVGQDGTPLANAGGTTGLHIGDRTPSSKPCQPLRGTMIINHFGATCAKSLYAYVFAILLSPPLLEAFTGAVVNA